VCLYSFLTDVSFSNCKKSLSGERDYVLLHDINSPFSFEKEDPHDQNSY